jgi:anionic cell wall polymer biosynthesis LytR-Cps2A-Psr (LCP) family protein
MTKNVTFYIVIIVFLVLGLITSIGTAYLAFRRPFNASPPVKTTVTIPQQTGGAEQNQESPVPTVFDLSINPTETSTVISEKTPVEKPGALSTPNAGTLQPNMCGLNDSKVLLLLGIEKNPSTAATEAKAIYLVKVTGTPSSPAIEYISIPSDLWISTPSLTDKYTISKIQIGSLFSVILNSESKNSDAANLASSAITSVIQDNFNINLSKYITTSSDKIGEMIDGIGGIEINNPTEIKDPVISIPSGVQIIKGKDAIALFDYVVNNQNSWDEINIQELILKGIHSRITSPTNPYKASGFLQSFKSSITTNLQDDDLVQLDCVLLNTQAHQITYDNIWQPLTSSSDEGLTINNENAVKVIIANILGEEFVSQKPTRTPTIEENNTTISPTTGSIEGEQTATPEPDMTETPKNQSPAMNSTPGFQALTGVPPEKPALNDFPQGTPNSKELPIKIITPSTSQ